MKQQDNTYIIPVVENSKICYLDFAGDESANTETSGQTVKTIGRLPDVMTAGGNVIVSGKGFSLESCELRFDSAVKFTAIAPDGTDYRELKPEFGALMWTGGCTLTLSSDVIFEHINIYSRSIHPNVLRISGGATVIFDDVRFRVQNSAHTKTALHIDAGSSAVLLGDNTGYLSVITGEGRLIIDSRLSQMGRITRLMTENFLGEICLSARRIRI